MPRAKKYNYAQQHPRPLAPPPDLNPGETHVRALSLDSQSRRSQTIKGVIHPAPARQSARLAAQPVQQEDHAGPSRHQAQQELPDGRSRRLASQEKSSRIRRGRAVMLEHVPCVHHLLCSQGYGGPAPQFFEPLDCRMLNQLLNMTSEGWSMPARNAEPYIGSASVSR